MSGLSNDDFRNLLGNSSGNRSSSSRGRGGGGGRGGKNDNNNNQRGSNKPNQSDSRWIPREEKPKDLNYRDRAEERRKGDDDPNKPMVKGLDKTLLQKTRLELGIDTSGDYYDDHHKSKNNESMVEEDDISKKDIKVHTDMGRTLLNTLKYLEVKKKSSSSSNQKGLVTELFLPNRMNYLFDLDTHFPQYIPTTIVQSKDDSDSNIIKVSARVDSTTLKKLVRLYSPNTIINDDNDNDNKHLINNNQDTKQIKKVIIEDDDDDNIFSDAEDYVCKTPITSTTTTSTTKNNSNNNQKKDYFVNSNRDSEDEDNFNPIGKDNDEDDEINSDDDNQNVKNRNTDNGMEQGPSMPSNYNMMNVEDAYGNDNNYGNDGDNYDEDEYQYPDTDQNYQDDKPIMLSSPSSSEDERDDQQEMSEALKKRLAQDELDNQDFDASYSNSKSFTRKVGEKSKEMDLLLASLERDKKMKKTTINKSKSEDHKITSDMVKIDQILKKQSESSGEKYVSILNENKKGKSSSGKKEGKKEGN